MFAKNLSSNFGLCAFARLRFLLTMLFMTIVIFKTIDLIYQLNLLFYYFNRFTVAGGESWDYSYNPCSSFWCGNSKGHDVAVSA